jgi:hypothetical protein
MAGTIIADYIRSDANKISLNVGNTVIASINASGILSNTGSVIISPTGALGSGIVLNKDSLPSGSVLQVIQTVKTDTFSTQSGSFTDVTGLSVSITPTKTSSKILVSCAVAVGYNNDGTASRRSGISLFRGATNLVVPTSPGSRSPAYAWASEMSSNEVYDTYCFEFLDSPNSTSSLSYNIKVLNGGAGSSIVYVNRSETDIDQGITGRAVSTITAMEIAG